MKQWMIRIDQGMQKFEKLLVWIGGGIILVMMMLITVDVFMRYVFNRPLESGIELVQFLFIGVVYFGISFVQAIKGHIRIDFLTQKFPETVNRKLESAGYVIALFIVALIFWTTRAEAWSAYVTGDYSMGIIPYPLWPAKSAVAFGFFLLWIRLLIDFVMHLMKIETKSQDSVSLH